MRKTIIFTILVLCLPVYSAYSQITDITWQHCFGTGYSADSYCIEKFDNGYLLGLLVFEGGPGVSNYHGSTDTWYIHLDSLGNLLWERCYGGSGGEEPGKIVPIDEEHCYIVNISTSTDGDVLCQNNGMADVWVAKLDRLGNILWQNCYGGPDYERVRDAILTPDGGLLLMSRIFDSGGDISKFYGEYDTWLCKIDSLGNIQWENTIGSPGKDNGLRVILTSGSTYLALCGLNDNGGMAECEHMGDPSYGLDIWLVELDLDGNILRQDCYGGTYDDLGWDIVECSDGFAFVASTESSDGDVSGNHGAYDFWLVKINPEREIVWQRCLGGSSYDNPVFLTQTEDKGFVLIGHTMSNNGDVSGNHFPTYASNDIWVVKTDPIGEPEWQHCFGSIKSERFLVNHTVAKISDYNYVLAPLTGGVNGDVNCESVSTHDHSWVFEIKDCALYQPQMPMQPTGQDTLCYTLDSASVYAINPASGAWGYTWQLQPEEAGTLTVDTLKAFVKWNQVYEGQANISVQSYNDCGESAWSPTKSTWVYNCVGLEEFNHSGLALKVYPNPAKNKVVFELNNFTPTSEASISIRDITGRTIAQIPIKQSRTSWSCEGLEAGVYFYSLQIGNGNISEKLLLQ
jgi:Secretion system C-terminal sorting domain/PKD-like domain